MLYRAIGIMSGSSLDGLDIAFCEFHEQAGQWTFELKQTAFYPYKEEWSTRLRNATTLSAYDYQLLHVEYGHYIGARVNEFIQEHQLSFQVALISSHGHTSFHVPARKMTAQLGDGAAIAAVTGLPVVSDLRSMDVALGGQGAPIVPIGEKLLFKGYDYFLNIGGIANISVNADPYIAFDICAANRVLNMLAREAGKEFDEDGEMAAGGQLNDVLLSKLNQLSFYTQPFPKSLANEFGTDRVYPLIKEAGLSIPDALRTYVEHIAVQVVAAIQQIQVNNREDKDQKLLVTGGGALNKFMVGLLAEKLGPLKISLELPVPSLINYKEALIMAFIGVLRWRQEDNVLSSVTGSARNSIGGALWTGQDA